MKEMTVWRSLMRDNNISSLNEAWATTKPKYLVELAETLHDHRLSDITNTIASSEGVKLVLLAGPSSSGKTTTAKRLALHMRVSGLNPVILSLDDYFKPRRLTPRDANGKYDFESLAAMDIPFLNEQLTRLFSGEEVEMPRYDFVSGERCFEGVKYTMKESDILVMEGIHGLNPELTPLVDDGRKFGVYVSVLNPLSIDDQTVVSASDYRLMRRMVRDNQFRGINVESTIANWQNVMKGEENNILPFKQNAQVQFNSSLIYELPILKCYAEPLLQTVRKDSPAYPEAERLLDMLHKIIAFNPMALSSIPPTSVIREFIGGSSFTY